MDTEIALPRDLVGGRFALNSRAISRFPLSPAGSRAVAFCSLVAAWDLHGQAPSRRMAQLSAAQMAQFLFAVDNTLRR